MKNMREPLDNEILFTDCKDTLNPEKYCEGVWALKTNDNNTYSSLKFHTERGGDVEQRVIKSLHKIQPATILGIAQHMTEEWRVASRRAGRASLPPWLGVV